MLTAHREYAAVFPRISAVVLLISSIELVAIRTAATELFRICPAILGMMLPVR